MIFKQVPRLTYDAIRRGNGKLLALVFDMCVPPLVVQLGLLIVALIICLSFVAALGINLYSIWILIFGIAIFISAIGLSWLKFGRNILPVSQFPKLVAHVGTKLGVYRGFPSNHSQRWIRTDRTTNRHDE